MMRHWLSLTSGGAPPPPCMAMTRPKPLAGFSPTCFTVYGLSLSPARTRFAAKSARSDSWGAARNALHASARSRASPAGVASSASRLRSKENAACSAGEAAKKRAS
jgi:hypothetical protein